VTGARRAAASVALALGTLSGCGGARPATRVVIVTLDTTRADHLGCYGYAKAATPNLDRLADESVLFENAVSPVPTTLPSHSTMFTGLYPQDHGVRYNLMFRLGSSAETLAEVLHGDGYATAGFPAVFIVGHKFGIDQGFDTYADPPTPESAKGDPSVHGGRSAAKGVDDALAWLGAQAADGKQFLWVHLYDPHIPYSPPFPYSSQYRDRPYDGEIAYMDAQLGRLIDALRRSPRWSSTLLIVVGDHGEGLYDHRERQHSSQVYESTQHVPLIVHAPGAGKARVAEPVSLADLFPTVLDYTGLPGRNVRGLSLRSQIEGHSAKELRDVYFESLAGSLNYGWAELRGVRHGAWKLIDAPTPELYRLDQDPGETDNLASREPERLAELRAALGALRDPLATATPSEPAHDPVLDPATERLLASLGYVTGGAGGSSADAPAPSSVIDLEPELLAGQSAVAQGQWSQVESLCRYVLERDPTNKWSLVNLASALSNTGRAREAQDWAAKLIELYPEAEQAYFQLGQALKLQGALRKAQDVFDRAVGKLPDSESLAYYRLVNAFDLRLPGLCEEGVPAAVTKFGRSGTIRVLLARCQARAGDSTAALATLGQAVDRGFRQIELLKEADEFRGLADKPAFRELAERASHAGP
jgi:arylsulfatase A-like enzyme